MTSDRSWIIRALIAWCGWVAITVGGGILATDGKSSLSDLVIHRVGPQFVLACVFLLATIRFAGWPTLGFVRPLQNGWWKLLWLPALLTALFAGLAIQNGLPAPAVIGFVFINTALVGFSEETMFRGILFQAFRKQAPVWLAIALSTVLFGSVHILNGFMTGDFRAATLQAVAAAMSGLMYMAFVIRSGSLWPSIVAHALWDFSLFLGARPETAPAQEAASAGGSWLGPVSLALPGLLYGLFLLRKIPPSAVTQDK